MPLNELYKAVRVYKKAQSKIKCKLCGQEFDSEKAAKKVLKTPIYKTGYGVRVETTEYTICPHCRQSVSFDSANAVEIKKPEIIFRGKHAESGVWMYGLPDSDNHDAGFPCILPDKRFYSEEDRPKDWEIDPATLTQYIGLKDKNGVKIFDGDILRTQYPAGRYHYAIAEYGKFNCSCCNGVYGWQFANGDIRLHNEYEIVGNIFDNRLDEFDWEG